MTDDPNDAAHEPEPSHGPDEEGEAPLAEEAHQDDRAAWVHRRKDRKPAEDAD